MTKIRITLGTPFGTRLQPHALLTNGAVIAGSILGDTFPAIIRVPPAGWMPFWFPPGTITRKALRQKRESATALMPAIQIRLPRLLQATLSLGRTTGTRVSSPVWH